MLIVSTWNLHITSNICTLSTPSYESLYTTSVTRDLSVLFQGRYSTTFVLDTVIEVTLTSTVQCR